MQAEQAKAQSLLEKQKEEFETKIQTDKNTEDLAKMSGEVRQKVTEANEIAKFMERDIEFSEKFVNPLNLNDAFAGSALNN